MHAVSAYMQFPLFQQQLRTSALLSCSSSVSAVELDFSELLRLRAGIAIISSFADQ